MSAVTAGPDYGAPLAEPRWAKRGLTPGQRAMLEFEDWDESNLAFHRSIMGADPGPDNTSALRQFEHEEPALKVDKKDTVVYLAKGEDAVDPNDGVPVWVPMIPEAFRDSYEHPAPYSNGRYPV